MRAVRKNNIRRWWQKRCFCLSLLRTTYTALFITFDSELEWCCRKSVQDERYIKVVDYSLVVGERGRGLLCIIWLTVSSLMGPKMNARQQRHVGALGNTQGSPRLTSAHLCSTRQG